jgi:hypothetical protein
VWDRKIIAVCDTIYARYAKKKLSIIYCLHIIIKVVKYSNHSIFIIVFKCQFNFKDQEMILKLNQDIHSDMHTNLSNL